MNKPLPSGWSSTKPPRNWPAASWSEWHWARLTPAGLAAWVSGGEWTLAPHLALLNRELMNVAAGRTRRLMVMMPPRHGKSLLASYYFPAWLLATFPRRRVLLTSYAGDFAASWGARTRDLLTVLGPRLGLRVRTGQSAKDRWELSPIESRPRGGSRRPLREYGGMMTAGVGGTLTGRGADLLIIDDPIKNAEQAHSPQIREKIWDWFQSTAYTRLSPTGGMVLIQTRWHEDDLAGRLLSEPADPSDAWSVVRLSAVAEADDPLGRETGAALWPGRFDLSALERIRRTIGGYWWSALYQQRPTPARGAIFRRSSFRYWHEEQGVFSLGDLMVSPHRCWYFATVDLAVSAAASADYTVLASWGVAPGGVMLLLDLIRERMPATRLIPTLLQLYARYTLDYVAIEKAGFQEAIIQQARQAGLPVRPLLPRGDKVSRAHTASTRFESGMVYFPVDAPWLGPLEQELLAFPHGKHDDQVDAVSYACLEVARRCGLEISAFFPDRSNISPCSARTSSDGGLREEVDE